MTISMNGKQPYWNSITELCELKIEEKYPKYGDSWVGFFDDEFWNKRLQGEVDESKLISSLDQDGRISELVDVINICAMQITNLLEDRKRQSVMMRLGHESNE